jgi:hypothetical protein
MRTMTDSDIVLAVVGLNGDLSPGGQVTLEKLIKALQDRERERCAQVAEQYDPCGGIGCDHKDVANAIAAKIREQKS